MKLKELIEHKNSWLVDVRSAEEVAEISVPTAEHIPMQNIMDNLPRFKAHEGPIVLFCATGNRSAQVMQYLKQSGCDAHNGGGYNDILQHQNNKS